MLPLPHTSRKPPPTSPTTLSKPDAFRPNTKGKETEEHPANSQLSHPPASKGKTTFNGAPSFAAKHTQLPRPPPCQKLTPSLWFSVRRRRQSHISLGKTTLGRRNQSDARDGCRQSQRIDPSDCLSNHGTLSKRGKSGSGCSAATLEALTTSHSLIGLMGIRTSLQQTTR